MQAPSSGLLKLPCGLRLIIYELVFGEHYVLILADDKIYRCSHSGTKPDVNPRQSDLVALLRTCRLILSEGFPVFFQQTRFYIEIMYSYGGWSSHRKSDQLVDTSFLRSIKKLKVWVMTSGGDRWCAQIIAATIKTVLRGLDNGSGIEDFKLSLHLSLPLPEYGEIFAAFHTLACKGRVQVEIPREECKLTSEASL